MKFFLGERMLYHAYILTIAMLLFLFASIEGYAVAKGKKSKDESRHRLATYPAYALFLIALFVYYGYESQVISSTPGAKDAFRSSGFLLPHVISIALSTVLLSITLVLGYIKRKVLFEEGIKKTEIAHMALGSFGIFFYVIAVFSGLTMYLKAGLL